MGKFPLYKFQGSAQELGHAHGEQLKTRIRETWEFYRSILTAPEKSIKELSLIFAEHIKLFNPSFAEEIDAIGQAAAMPSWQIYALNSRTELIRTLNMPPECTVFCFKEASTIAQTWDWAGALESLAIILQLEKEDGHKILMMTEPGIIGKIGLNSSGLGVGMSILKRPLKRLGLPVHVLLRALLEARSLGEIEAIMKSSGVSSNSNIVAADSKGGTYAVEISDSKIEQYGGDVSSFVHTNHYLALDVHNIVDEDFDSSQKRLLRGKALSSKLLASPGIEAIKAMLLDQENGTQAICHEIHPDSVIGSVGTLCALILDLPRKTLHFTPGCPLGNDFMSFTLR